MRPGMMTDGEINAELRTALGERRADLIAEREDRKAVRAGFGKPAGEPVPAGPSST
jgi:hypothetical protein